MWGTTDDKASIATIHAALDLGITSLDTAPAYGKGASEEIVGRALAGRRTEALILTKVGEENFTAPGVRASCEASLRRLGTDYLESCRFTGWVTRLTSTR